MTDKEANGIEKKTLFSRCTEWCKKPKNYGLIFLWFLALSTLLITVWLIFNNQTIRFGGESGESNDNNVVGIERNYDGIPSASEGKIEATEKAGEMLELAYVEFSNENEIIEYAETIDNNDFEVIDNELRESVRIIDLLDSDDNAETATYQLLIMLAAIVYEVAESTDNEPFEPLWEDFEIQQNVLYDEEVGIAYVPVSTFAGNQASLTLEMVWIDGEWYLQPYSLIEGVSLSSTLGEFDDDEIAELDDINPEFD